MPPQVAAVHGRDIDRRQGLPRLGVIPVVEMTPVARQCGHAVQGVGGALQHLSGGEVTEVVGGQVSQQGQAHVGRRGAMGQGLGPAFLVVVGRQPMVLRSDAGLEEGPGLAGDPAQETDLFRRQTGRRAGDGPADPPGDGG